MNIQECIKFTTENPVCYLATAEGNQPRVRALGFWFADETGFYFQSATVKKLTEELKNNPKTEVCFYDQGQPIGKMLRIEGEVEFIDNMELREKVFQDRPFLKQFGMTVESPGLVLFRIPHGKAHFWTMEDNLAPKSYIEF